MTPLCLQFKSQQFAGAAFYMAYRFLKVQSPSGTESTLGSGLQNFLNIEFNQIQCKTQRIRLDIFLLLIWSVSPLYNELLWILYLSKWGRFLPYLYWSVERHNKETQINSTPNHGLHALGYSKIHFNNTFVGTNDPICNKGITSIIYMVKYINDIPNKRNNIYERGNNNKNTK